jgi:hypothetical protein
LQMTPTMSGMSVVNDLCVGGVSGKGWRHHGGFPHVVARLAENYPRQDSPDNHNNQWGVGTAHPGTSALRNACRSSHKVAVIVVWSQPKLEYVNKFYYNSLISNFMKILPVVLELWPDRQTDGLTDEPSRLIILTFSCERAWEGCAVTEKHGLWWTA